MPKLTLAQRLQFSVPKVYEIIKLGDLNSMKLFFKPSPIHLMTKFTQTHSIPSLILTVSSHKLVSLSSNQIGLTVPVVVVHKNPILNKWTDYEGNPNDYNAYINPSFKQKNSEAEEE